MSTFICSTVLSNKLNSYKIKSIYLTVFKDSSESLENLYIFRLIGFHALVLENAYLESGYFGI